MLVHRRSTGLSAVWRVMVAIRGLVTVRLQQGPRSSSKSSAAATCTTRQLGSTRSRFLLSPSPSTARIRAVCSQFSSGSRRRARKRLTGKRNGAYQTMVRLAPSVVPSRIGMQTPQATLTCARGRRNACLKDGGLRSNRQQRLDHRCLVAATILQCVADCLWSTLARRSNNNEGAKPASYADDRQILGDAAS